MVTYSSSAFTSSSLLTCKMACTFKRLGLLLPAGDDLSKSSRGEICLASAGKGASSLCSSSSFRETGKASPAAGLSPSKLLAHSDLPTYPIGV